MKITREFKMKDFIKILENLGDDNTRILLAMDYCYNAIFYTDFLFDYDKGRNTIVIAGKDGSEIEDEGF